MLKLQEVDKPVPQGNEVLIKVQAASLNAADWHLLRADFILIRLDAGMFRMLLASICHDQGTVMKLAVTKAK